MLAIFPAPNAAAGVARRSSNPKHTAIAAVLFAMMNVVQLLGSNLFRLCTGDVRASLLMADLKKVKRMKEH